MLLLIAASFIHYGTIVTFKDDFYGPCVGKVTHVREYWGGHAGVVGMRLMSTYIVESKCSTGFKGNISVNDDQVLTVRNKE